MDFLTGIFYWIACEGSL